MCEVIGFDVPCQTVIQEVVGMVVGLVAMVLVVRDRGRAT